MPSARGWLRRPWTIALAVALPLATIYLIVAPSAADLAAATYRSDLFARAGFTTWDTGWYAAHGHWLPAYSLLSPALGALLGVRTLLALSAVAASVLFALIAERVFGITVGRVSAAVFALGFCVGLLSGRVPYDLGFSIGLGAVLALMRGHLALALGLALLTSAASPVAGAFLALAGVAGGLGGVFHEKTISTRARGAQRWLGLTVAAATPILALSLAYPEGGYEPFALSAFWPALAGVVLIALLLPYGSLTPNGRRVVRIGAALYALALIGAYAIHTPVGGNAARLGPPLAAPLLAGVLWDKRRGTLLLLAPLLLYWQLVTPIRDYAQVAGDPSVNASYYAPLLAELRRLREAGEGSEAKLGTARGGTQLSLAGASRGGRSAGAPTVVEVPLTKAHWEAAYLAGHDGISLARGWERQLDTRYAAIFYRPTLTTTAYRAWLAENKVRYVALPDAPLDGAGRLEGALIARGAPYLRELWRSGHWRLYRVMG
jgi:hypothetical protein